MTFAKQWRIKGSESPGRGDPGDVVRKLNYYSEFLRIESHMKI